MKITAKQQGFTLIELMIVVAVIGVLAAVAMPQYQKYVGKSEAASALATLSALKTNIETYTLEQGQFPDDGDPNVKALLGLPSALSNAIAVTRTQSAAGSVIVNFNNIANASPSIKTTKIGLFREQDGTWSCGSSASTDSGLLPKGCTNKSGM
ncbi:pilin [Vibrio hangzhouensis]|uniref:Type IV pilus assembly protein PilA n=1 Tax=Vibrio hangzhouensis TaxID=462991 RepID=A0A1H5XEY0_9VIBR|nr:pilin [Vibrio hangzhouensis]SEG09907.1 type IV pilus assembly protein PilA [Vibrio hangzhouensis]